LNSLRRGGATLTNFYAEDHPSDANYLALAGGGAFGVPLTDPEEENPLYCASHVVPLEELTSDLANPATTPNFAWVAPDDCADMEGCGIAAGDEFLKTELTTVTLIDTKTGRVYSPVRVGSYPVAAAITG
jgi:hypothetical protein